MKTNSMPKVTVVSPYAGGDSLVYFLQSMLQQTLDPALFELILVEDGDFDSSGTVRLFNFGFRVTVIPFNRPSGFNGHSAGLCRNAGARLALGTTLVFVDSDCILHPDCIRLHYEVMSDRPDLALCGLLKELPAYNSYLLERGFYGSYDELSQASLPDHRSKPLEDEIPPSGDGWDFWYSGNASVSRSAFLQVGGFDKSGHRCHDLELAYRLFRMGLKFEYSQLAEAIHVEHPRSIDFRKEQMQGVLYIGKKHPELKRFAEDQFIVKKRALEGIAERCESKFQQIIHNLPGVRAGFSWVATPGVAEEQLAPSLDYIPYFSAHHKDNVRLNLRLHRSCWDYNIILPESIVVDHPSITVILPVYNGSHRVLRAVQSVFLQTCQSFELIVVDDASTDGTLKEVEPYRVDPRFRVISLRSNHGLSNALNIGLEASMSAFVLQLDADDWLEPTALETVLKHFMTDDSVAAVYGDAILHDGNGSAYTVTGEQLQSPVEYFEYFQCQVPRAFRKSVLIDRGGWTVSDAQEGRYYEDRLILAKISETHKVLWMPEKLYHVEERRDSLYRAEPLASASAKLPILQEQANRRGYSMSYVFQGNMLKGKFRLSLSVSPGLSWSVVIPFHRSLEQLGNSLRSWLESDFLAAPGEIIVVDEGSDEDARKLIELSPERIRVLRFDARNGPAWARNAGAATSQYEMLFFSDADHIVPPNVISSHERRHGDCPEDAIVIGNVFGRRTFSVVEPGCRSEHKRRLLDILRFDARLEGIASMLACDRAVSLMDDSDTVWKSAQAFSITDAWLADWAAILIKYGENLEAYPHRWTRVSSGSMSIRRGVFKRIGGFDERLPSMEDWELGARAQKDNIAILCAPEAEPYHQVHPVDADRWRNDHVAVQILAAKHGELVKSLISASERFRPPAAAPIRAIIHARDANRLRPPEEQAPRGAADSYCVLTFDDGPHPLATPLILEALGRFNSKAIFFFLGAEAAKYKELCLRVADAGHEIGVHGWTHTSAERFTTIEHFERLSRAINVIEEASGSDVRYTRPPYGRLSAAYADAAEKLGLHVVGWDVSSEDYSAPSHVDIIKNLASQGVRNKVLLFHDGAGDAFITLRALEWLLKACSDSGIRLISLAECSRLRELPSLGLMDLT